MALAPAIDTPFFSPSSRSLDAPARNAGAGTRIGVETRVDVALADARGFDRLDVSVEARVAFETARNRTGPLAIDIAVSVNLSLGDLLPATAPEFDLSSLRDAFRETLDLDGLRAALRSSGLPRTAGLPDTLLSAVQQQAQSLLDGPFFGDYITLLELLAEDPEKVRAFVERVEAALQRLQAPANAAPSDPAANRQSALRIQVDVSVDIRGLNDALDLRVDVRVNVNQNQEVDPLVVDLDGDGVELTTAETGRRFDIDGDGRLDRTAFVTGDDALLALDRNGNGTIDDGRELFGDQHGATDGFAELARFDDDGNGTIDARDRVFDQLVLLRGDGTTLTLAQAGITAIRLDARAEDGRANGNRLVASAAYARADGTLGRVYEAMFSVVG